MPASLLKNSKRICAFLFLVLISKQTFSQSAKTGALHTVKGHVFEQFTGYPLYGASIHLKDTKYRTIANLDGSFTLKNIPAGHYELDVDYAGYEETGKPDVTVEDRDVKLPDVLMSQKAANLTSVTVTSTGNKTGDDYVRNLEKNSVTIVNSLSQKAIELSPDVTAAAALQRISGVAMQRDNAGEARYAIIRGMEQRYNSTLVNGIKIPSPDDQFRFVPMNLFPADMLERIEVIKALTPNMEGDAIGGTMNLVMKTAPSRLLVDANGSLGYNTLFSNRPFTAFDHFGVNFKSPAEIYGNSYYAGGTTGANQQLINTNFPLSTLHYKSINHPLNNTLGLTIGDRFFNNKLGAVISANYQDFYTGSNSEFLMAAAQPSATLNDPNQPTFTDGFERKYSTQTNRIGVHTKWDYAINNKNSISFYGMFIRQNDFQVRYTPDTTIGTNSSASSKSVKMEWRSTWQQQTIYNYTLSGKHEVAPAFLIDWNAVYSKAINQLPDQATYNYNENILYNTSTGQIDTVEASTYGAGMERMWRHNSDRDKAGYLNFTYTPHLFNQSVEFKLGGLYRDKTRDNYMNDYKLVPNYTITQPWVSVDQTQFWFNPAANGQGINTASDNNTYTFGEKISAGYLQTKFLLMPQLQVFGGVRVEHTAQNYVTAEYPIGTGSTGTIHYTDVLPSVHFKYTLSDLQDIRLSYYKAISRPGFGDIVPIQIPGEVFTIYGNPYIMHTRSDNFDLRYELYSHHADQLLLGAFYKKMENPIEYIVVQTGTSSQGIYPENSNTAKNMGLEAVFTKYFGMFGINLNYTYTYSRVTTTKYYSYYSDTAGQQKTLVNQTRQLQGQAPHVGNFSLLYKNPKIGLNADLAYSYTGKRIALVSPYYGLDYWQKPLNQLDFSADQKFAKRFYVYVKINNLLNTPASQYINSSVAASNAQFSNGYQLPFQKQGSNQTLVQKNIYNTSFLIGIRFQLNK